MLNTCLLSCLLCGCFAAVVHGAPHAPDRQVASVNGYPVTVRELQIAVEAHRTSVINEIRLEHGTTPEDDATFWTRDLEDGTPLQRLRRVALEQALVTKLEQVVSTELGIEAVVAYSDFLEKWREENGNRQTIKDQGGVIYGPIQYREFDYFRYLHSNLQIKVQNRLRSDPALTREADLRELYARSTNLFALPDSLEFVVFRVPAGRADTDAIGALVTWRERLRDRSAQAADAMPGEGLIERVTHRIGPDDKIGHASLAAEYAGWAMQLAPGEISPVREDEVGNRFFVRLIARQNNGARPYEVVRPALLRLLMKEKYAKLIATRRSAACVTITGDVDDIVLALTD